MCRAVAYLGPPVPLADLLHRPNNGLVAQTYDPKQLHMLNLAGFGLTSWASEVDEPLVYRSTVLPVYDANLASLARHVSGECVVAHVRGIAYRDDAGFGAENLHPFRYPDAPVVLAHNGDLDGFSRMRVPLMERIHPEIAVHLRGTTDSEWIYALLLTHLRTSEAGVEGLLSAVEATIRTLQKVRAELGIDTSSSMNLFLASGDHVVALRYTFDFGRYPLDPSGVHEANARYLSLWYTQGARFEGDGEGAFWMSRDEGRPQAFLAASEPLTSDPSGWVEVPEYSAVVAVRSPTGLAVEIREMDL